MKRIFISVVLCAITRGTLALTTFGRHETARYPSAIPPSFPTVYPYNPTSSTFRPFVHDYNNPYYNAVGGPAVPILTYSNEHGGDGSYSYSFTTADGKQVEESGYLKDAYLDNAGEPQGTQVVQGSYAYVSPEGTPVQVSYVADENGFRPSGVRIPADGRAPPPLSELINGRKDFRGSNILNPSSQYFPYTDRNRYNYFGKYNPLRPYDPRYPYDPSKYSHDPVKYPYDTIKYPYGSIKHPYDPRYPYDSRYNPNNHINPSWAPGLYDKTVKEELKKESSS